MSLVAAVVASLSTRGPYEPIQRVGLVESAGGAVIVRLADRTHAGRVGEQSLIARAISPLAHCVRGARLCTLRRTTPRIQGCIETTTPPGVVLSIWSCCRTTLPGRSTCILGVVRPFGASTGGALPPPSDQALGRPKNAGAFFLKAAPPAFGSTGWGRCGLRCCALQRARIVTVARCADRCHN